MPGGTELRIKRILSLLVIYLFLVTVLIFSLYPILWTVLTSLKTSIETIKNPYSLPETIQWANYAQAWVIGRFGTYSWNSIFITVPTVLLITTVVRTVQTQAVWRPSHPIVLPIRAHGSLSRFHDSYVLPTQRPRSFEHSLGCHFSLDGFSSSLCGVPDEISDHTGT